MSRATSRLLGFAGGRYRQPPERRADALPVLRPRVLRQHREDMPSRFLADLQAEGKVEWQSPEPVLLRPGRRR